MKTGKITVITPDGTWSNGSKTFNRYKVTMATGEVYQFNAVGEFKKAVGDEIEFEVTNTQYNTAKIIYPKPQGNFQPQQGNFTKKPDDVQRFIIKQSSVASAVNFYRDQNASEEQVLAFADRIVNYIYQ